MTLTRRSTLLAPLGTSRSSPASPAARPATPIRIGTLTPQTGAGGVFGPVDGEGREIAPLPSDINAAGGVIGRKIEIVSEDDETNPDAGVRAARKLIDVNKVDAVAGTWASAVTTAVAPLCWENKVMLFTVSGADSITRLPHMGYIIRTQPNTYLQATRAGRYIVEDKARRLFALSAQTPFAADTYGRLAELLRQGGADPLGNVIYDAGKTTFRSEIDQALKPKPDAIYLNSYTPDLIVLLRELYRAGYEGKRYTPGYAATQKLLDALPADLVDGLVSYAPTPDLGSPAYARVTTILGSEPDPYSAQIYDHISLIALSIGQAKSAEGKAIRDTVRAVGDAAGTKVTNAVDGLKLIADGRARELRGRLRPLQVHRYRRHPGLQVPFRRGREGKVQAAEHLVTAASFALPLEGGDGGEVGRRRPIGHPHPSPRPSPSRGEGE